jgi:hypothetical protein
MEEPFKGPRANDQASGTAAPGRPLDEPSDLITPLNVRDPSALVMAPSLVTEGAAQPMPNIQGKPVPQPKARRKKPSAEMPHG